MTGPDHRAQVTCSGRLRDERDTAGVLMTQRRRKLEGITEMNEYDPMAADGDSPEGAAMVDAAMRLIRNLNGLSPQHRAACEAACMDAKKETMKTPQGLSQAGIWDSLQQLVRAVRAAAGDTR